MWDQGCGGQGEGLLLVLPRWSRQWVLSGAAMHRPITMLTGGSYGGAAGVCMSLQRQLRPMGGGQGVLLWCRWLRAAVAAPGVPGAGAGVGWQHRARGWAPPQFQSQSAAIGVRHDVFPPTVPQSPNKIFGILQDRVASREPMPFY